MPPQPAPVPVFPGRPPTGAATMSPAMRGATRYARYLLGSVRPWLVPPVLEVGAGFGTYWAAAPALLTQVLPAAADRAKDLGIINIAYSLPLVVAPLVAGVVLGLMNSYPALFALAGVVTVIAGLTVSRVRSVR